MEVEYLLRVTAVRKPRMAVMASRREKVVSRSLVGPRRGRTRCRWSSSLEMETEEESEESHD